MPLMNATSSNQQRPDKIGTLFVVATPIGNLADLSPRAQAVLDQVAVIAAEDTRVSQRLLQHRSGSVRMISVNEQSERGAVSGLIEQLKAGQDVALVSDAGTPLISDPGYRLVAAAHEAGVPVCPLPGPCAAIAALSAAGLPSDRFFFEGFLPARQGARRKRIEMLADQSASLIFYVPARDLPPVMADLAMVLGDQREATLARELTKLHETIRRSTLSDLQNFVAADANQQRGEAVLIVSGNPQPQDTISPRALAVELARELPPARAAKVLGRLSGLTRQQAWDVVNEATPES